MKKNTPLPFVIVLVSIFFLSQPLQLKAQINDIGIFLKAGVEDAGTLIKGYLEPLPSGIGANLNSGWITDASPHKTLGFSIQIRGALAFVPTADQTFDISKLSLNNVQASDPSETISPTIGGNNKTGPEVVVKQDGSEVARFTLPSGSGYHLVPTPMIQASIGLIKNTDVTVRYVPEIDISDYGNIQMIGVGVMHELTQWLPGNKLIPVTVSIFGGYTNIDLFSNLNVNPQPGAIPDPNYTGNYGNQKTTVSFDTYTTKLIVGKNLPFISLYGAVGYEWSTMTAALTGDYPVPVSGPAGTTRTKTVTDPIVFDLKGDNTYSFTAGVKFSIFFFKIYGQYTWAKYSTVNAGIGFSFR